MIVDTYAHKMLHYLEHLWPYVTTLIAALVTGIRLWWIDRRNTRKRVANVEYLVEWLKEHSVTHTDLIECRNEVREVDEKNLDMLFREIKGLTKDNAQQHTDIMKDNSEQFEKVMKQIIELHKK